MSDYPLLSLTIFLPLVGALFILLFLRDNDPASARNAQKAGLFTTIATFILSLVVWKNFNIASPDFQLQENVFWIDTYHISYHLGIDGISLIFVLLTTFLMPFCILAGWKVIEQRVREYVIAFLLLECFILGVFCSLDFVLFYFFFEAVLIPMFLIIGIWGGTNRVYAAFKFFLYTLVGSVLLLLAMLYLYQKTGTTDIPTLMSQVPLFSLEVQKWLWLALFASFAVKVPMWPFHTWLPDAHVQAPTAGSMMLAGVLLKMGAYGFLRFSLPMLPAASDFFAEFVFGLSIIAVVYTSLVALVQQDMKKLIAYSSVAHMGFVTAGIFAFNVQGIEGGIFQMLSHGLVSAALFMCVGVVYDRMHTREVAHYGGLVNRMPAYAFVFVLFTMASVGLPGTSGFVGEMLVLIGTFQANKLVAMLLATGLVLGAAYMLWLVARMIFGELKRKELRDILDLEPREKLIFYPIIIMTIFLGVYPNAALQISHPAVDKLIQQYEHGKLKAGGGHILPIQPKAAAAPQAQTAPAALPQENKQPALPATLTPKAAAHKNTLPAEQSNSGNDNNESEDM